MKKLIRILCLIYIVLFANIVSADAVPTKSSEVDLTPKEKDSNHTTYFLLAINPPLSVDASIDYRTRDDTAIAGKDYISIAGTASIKAGKTSVTIAVEIIGDTIAESDERFALVISNPKGANFPSGKTELIAYKTIIDDDDGSTNTTASLSGNISAAVLITTDSDVNDPQTTLINNDTFSTAQEINNFYTISGFASTLGTNTVGINGHFSIAEDRFDVYKVNLQEKQQITLQVIDHAGQDVFQGDLDLQLYDADFNFIALSNSENEIETISVPFSATFYIAVRAYSGISKYVLNLGSIVNSTSLMTPNVLGKMVGNFRLNEAIISYRSTQILNAYKIQSNMNLTLSHQQTDRAVLAEFIQPATPLFRALTSNKLAPFLQELQQKNPHAFDQFNTLSRIKELNLNPSIQIAEPNYIKKINQIPNDQGYSLQWHYPAISLPQAWDITEGSAQVIVAVLDTGVFLAHDDLVGQLVDGYDFIRDPSKALDGDGIDANPDDPGDLKYSPSSSWHGTHVSGTIAANSNNSLGVAGIAPNSKIMPLRVLGFQGGFDYDIGQALLYAAGLANDSGTVPTQKADIINMSLGSNKSGGTQQFQNIVSAVRAQGLIIIAAAGNEGHTNESQISYPASYAGVVSVAATDMKGIRSYYSDHTSTVDIAAPGGDTSKDLNNDGKPDGIASTLVDDTSGVRQSIYTFDQGTSMAAPHVAGVVALMKSVYPQLTPNEFDNLLISGQLTDEAGASGHDSFYGYGLLNAAKAVKVAFELNNEGAVEIPALIRANPSSLNFSPNETSATLILNNIGEETASITSISSNVNWLSINPANIDTTTNLGTYQVSINRNGLSDSSYTAKITFNLSTGDHVIVQVGISVGSQNNKGELGEIYVLLFRENGDLLENDVLTQTNSDGTLSYQFNNVPSGNYYIYAGSDIDNDQFICQLSENCGGYPILNSTSLIKVTDKNIDNLNFTATILSTIHSITGASLLNADNSSSFQGIKRLEHSN